MQRKHKIVFGMEQPRFENRSNGVSRVCQIQMNCLEQLGHETHLVMPRYPGAVAEKGDIQLPSICLSKPDNYFITNPFHYPEIHLQLLEYCLKLKPDLFYLNGPYWTAMHLASIARKMGVPYILHLHTDIKGYAMARSPGLGGEIGSRFMFFLAKGIVKNASKRVFPSVFYRDIFTAQTRCSGVSEVLPSVIPEFPLMTKNEKRDFAFHFRLKNSIPLDEEKHPLIVVNGRVKKEKSPERAIQHLKHLFDQFPENFVFQKDPCLVFVGEVDSKYKEELLNLALSLKVRYRVFFVGELSNSELLKVNQIAWLLWFTSTTDTQGLVLVEAAAGGLLVMGCKDKVFYEFFPDDFLAVDNSSNSSDEWGKRTMILLESPEFYQEKADFCRKKAKAYTDIASYQEKYMRIIEQAIDC